MKYYEVRCAIRPFSEAAADVLSACLAEAGFEAFSPAEDGLLAYIRQSEWDEDAVRQVVQDFPLRGVDISCSCSEAPDEDWNKAWEEEGFQPICLTLAPSQGGGTIVVHDVRHTDVPAARYDIVIAPRLAFGTGSHATTRLILRTLAGLDLEGRRVIDAGTGTGILSIMAIKRGAASVLAYDIDEWSVQNARDNLLLNQTASTDRPSPRLSLAGRGEYPGEGLPVEAVVVCGDSSVLEGQAKADLLIANINRNILLKDLPRFARAVRQGGMMVLSGFCHEDIPVLEEAAAQQGFSLLKEEREGEWAMLLFEANAPGRRDV